MVLHGYIKANKITNEYIIRQDMEPKKDAEEISISKNNKGEIFINEQKIELLDLYNIDTINENVKTWGNISTKGLNLPVDELLADFKARTIVINQIVDLATNKKISNLNIDFTSAKDENAIKRFTIEITPKLREVGITTSIELNENINRDDFYKIVDYIITDK